MVSSSHDYRLEIINGNQASFIFDNINLPPEIINLEESNGYVAFKIKPKSNLQIGDVIENKANIYFDYNAPIITNTVQTELVDQLSLNAFEDLEKIVLYPIPSSGNITLQGVSGDDLNSIEIYSVLGKKVGNYKASTIDISNLESGVYFIKIATTFGSMTKRIIKE